MRIAYSLLRLTLQTVCTWIQLCGNKRSLTRCSLWTRVHLLSPSSLEVKSIGRQAKITSTDCSVTDEDHVCQTCGGPPGARTVTYIWRSRGRDCNVATKYHRMMSPPKRYVTITKLCCARHYKFSFRTSHTVTHKILSSFTEISLQCVIVFQLARYIKFGNLGTCKAVSRWHITIL